MEDRKRILVVDDEEQVLFVLRNGLKRLGDQYEIVTARNGQEALEVMRKAPVDLIITDLKMPGIDGVTLTEVAYATVPSTKVIWMTAYDRWETDAQRLGVYRYLLKPLDVADIRQAVSEALKSVSGAPDKDKIAKPKHILIIDDEPQEALDLYGALDSLTGVRYYVKITLVPEEALDSLKSENFDLVIAGLHTPGIDSLDLIRRVRQVSPQARTLLIGAQWSPELEEQARRVVTAYLTEPFDMEDFTATVQGILAEGDN